jgi:hypothetical protein
MAVALGYIEFRLPTEDFGITGTPMKAWAHAAAHRPSLAATVPTIAP